MCIVNTRAFGKMWHGQRQDFAKSVKILIFKRLNKYFDFLYIQNYTVFIKINSYFQVN